MPLASPWNVGMPVWCASKVFLGKKMRRSWKSWAIDDPTNASFWYSLLCRMIMSHWIIIFQPIDLWKCRDLQVHDSCRWKLEMTYSPNMKNRSDTKNHASLTHHGHWCYTWRHHDYTKLGGGFKYVLFSPRTLGKIPILTNIFQGWCNHQLEKHWGMAYAWLALAASVPWYSQPESLNTSVGTMGTMGTRTPCHWYGGVMSIFF